MIFVGVPDVVLTVSVAVMAVILNVSVVTVGERVTVVGVAVVMPVLRDDGGIFVDVPSVPEVVADELIVSVDVLSVERVCV